MRYVYSLALVVFLAAVGSTPLCHHSKANHQDVFSHRLHHSELEDDGPIVYLPPGDGAVDLDSMMHDLIAEEMTITYDEAEYVKSLLEKLCSFHQGMFECILEVLEPPTIQVIPTKQVSKDIVCTTATCGIELDESVSVSTTNSLEVSLTIEVGGEPFGVGVKFSGTVGYGFSETKEITTGLKYSYDLERNDTGYIGMVNAQVSSTVRLIACKCKWIDIQCIEGCRDNGPNYNVTGHHEVVVLKDDIPRSYIEIPDKPTIHVIQTEHMSKDIACTTHSVEIEMTIETDAELFGVGVKFTFSASYGYSHYLEKVGHFPTTSTYTEEWQVSQLCCVRLHKSRVKASRVHPLPN
ncbi:hypothetical protein BG000_000478 [Podila horticola]|nr:hypothetical protein BG000_000478 [Podila horticola]